MIKIVTKHDKITLMYMSGYVGQIFKFIKLNSRPEPQNDSLFY